MVGLQDGPALSPPGPAARLDDLDHGRDKLVGQLVLTAWRTAPSDSASST